jgi:hypothetical protein
MTFVPSPIEFHCGIKPGHAVPTGKPGHPGDSDTRRQGHGDTENAVVANPSSYQINEIAQLHDAETANIRRFLWALARFLGTNVFSKWRVRSSAHALPHEP